MKEIDFQMIVTKRNWKVKTLCFVMVSVIAVSFVVSRNNSELEGVFTNSKSDECPSFISVEFRGDTFISILNIPIAPHGEVPEHISERIKISEGGYYFIQIVQQLTFGTCEILPNELNRFNCNRLDFINCNSINVN